MILLKSRKKCRQAKSLIFSGRWSKTQNGDQNQINPSLRLQNCSLLNLKRGLKNSNLKVSDQLHVVFVGRTGLLISSFNLFARFRLNNVA